jgi:signal transduction histidine kinase
MLDGPLHHLVDLFGVPHVDLNGQWIETRMSKFGAALLEVCRIAAADRHLRAELPEAPRDREADPRTTAGDDRDLPIEKGWNEHAKQIIADAKIAKPVVDPRPEEFARLFEAVHEGVYIGTIARDQTQTLSANPYLKLMFGFAGETPEADVRPFDAERFVDPQARDAFVERLAHDNSVTDYLLRLRRADRAPMWVEVTAHARAEGDGVRIEALMRDVSERKRLEDQARDLYHQLLQAEKLAALGQTISGVAHELNNPLATILTWAERLAQRPADDQTRRGLAAILAESERAARIVRNLLTFARKRHTTRAMVDLNQVIRETLALRSYEQRLSNIAIIDALASGLPNVFADPHQMQQVLLNLVINAEQAMLSTHGRGTLILRTWHDPDHDAVVLEVNDDGPGVPDDVQPKIFDPFFTTKEVGKGTGLGLTVAYAIVQEHGGRLTMKSQPGGGASFFVELPVTGAGIHKTLPKAPERTFATPVTAAGSSILVVEDEAALGAAVAEALADAGFVVDRACDGVEALERVRARAYDLIVCDLKMPRLDGPSFYRELKGENAPLAQRILFVTGDVAGTEAERFLEESGCRWLAKPFRLKDLLRSTSELIERI